MSSPFLIVQDFISGNMCERMISDLDIKEPNLDINGNPTKLERHNLFWDNDICERFRDIVPQVEQQYNCQYSGLQQPVFQQYPENPKAPAEQPGCENSKYVRKKWVMYKDVDLVGFIWLKDYNQNVPLDPRIEVFGGKMEFPVHNFSLVPQRGTLILFPAGPHFISVISPVLLGDLYQIKINVNIKNKDGSRWLYQPQNFPGTWKDWLNEYL